MISYMTRTAVEGIDAATVLSCLLAHLSEHDLNAVADQDSWTLDYDGARIVFLARRDTLQAEVQAPTQEALFDARMMVHYHVAEFADRDPELIHWQGDKPEFERPPAFRLLDVAGIEDLSPHLRRVRFRGTDLHRYQTDDHIHCKLLIPQPGDTCPQWPTLGTNGLPKMPEGTKRLDMRTYTIRRIDASAGWMEIDFVLHQDAGPGSGWAARAQMGHQLGVSGPGGRTARPADWMLLAADETGLPAIARIVEGLPGHTRGAVIVEVQDAGDEIPLHLPAGMEIHWLHRGQAPAGSTTHLRDAILAYPIPAGGDRFVWVACEFATAQEVRPWLRQTIGLDRHEQLVVAYWRQGIDETRMKGGRQRRSAGVPQAGTAPE